MPLILWLGGMLLTITGSIVGRVLLALGFGLVSFTGFQLLLDNVFAELKANMSGMPGEVLSFLAFMWVDRAINMIVSAINAAMLIKLAGSTSIKKWIVTRPTV